MTLQDAILKAIELRPGIGGVKLMLEVMDIAGTLPLNLDREKYQSIIEELVWNGEIIEIEYVLSVMPYRVKSIYFPKGTTFPNRKGLK